MALFWGALVLVTGVLALYLFTVTPPSALLRVVRLTIATVLALLAMLLLFSKQFTVALLLLSSAYMVAKGRFPQNSNWRRGSSQNQSTGASNVKTDTLKMTLDHGSGQMDGEVLVGLHRRKKLSQMAFEDILELLRDCATHDPESAVLVEAYLDRAYGADWRAKAPGGQSSANGDQSSSNGAMAKSEALEILGLQEGASRDEIRDAHKKLMLKMHPDQGGSTYLATKINRAKEVLLEGA
jgi:hypothetical protein